MSYTAKSAAGGPEQAHGGDSKGAHGKQPSITESAGATSEGGLLKCRFLIAKPAYRHLVMCRYSGAAHCLSSNM